MTAVSFVGVVGGGGGDVVRKVDGFGARGFTAAVLMCSDSSAVILGV